MHPFAGPVMLVNLPPWTRPAKLVHWKRENRRPLTRPGYTNAQVHVGSAAGTVLFTGGPTGSNISSGSVTDGTTIYLVDGNSGTTLQTLLLNVTQTPYAFSQDFIWLGRQVIAIENGNGH